jgi:putative Holliday junction resolvase
MALSTDMCENPAASRARALFGAVAGVRLPEMVLKSARKLALAMIVDKMSDLRAAVPRGRRLLGLDLGSKTIGCALSDVGWVIASPLTTLARKARLGPTLTELLALLDRHDVGGLVLGLPVNMDGTEGPRCQSTRAFAGNLLAARDFPLMFWDERLSTAAVERMLIAADASRKRRAELVDKLAAAYILQGALDAFAHGG